MALPTKLDRNINAGDDTVITGLNEEVLPSRHDVSLNLTIIALEEMFGIPDDVEIVNPATSFSSLGCVALNFQDGAIDPASSGQLVMNGADLKVNLNGTVFTLTGQESGAGATGLVQSANEMINGDMDVWQESASIAITFASDDYTADQHAVQLVGTEYAGTVTQSTDVPTIAQAGKVIRYSHLLTTTTEETALADGDFLTLISPLTGDVVNGLAGQTVTLTFWTKSSQAGTFCMFLTNGASTFRSYVKTFVVTAATWEQHSFTLTMDDQSVGTWDNDVGLGLKVGITLSSGSDFEGTDGTWETAQDISVSTCTNTWMTTAALTFQHTDIQFSLGSRTANTRIKSHNQNVLECNRFYGKSYEEETVVGTATRLSCFEFVDQGQGGKVTFKLPAPMRAIPTMTWYSTETLNASTFYWCFNHAASFGALTGVGQAGPSYTVLSYDACGTSGHIKFAHWTADARLTI